MHILPRLAALIVAGTVLCGAAPPGIIVMGKAIDDMVSLDPAEVYEASGGEVVGNLYDRLVETDPHDPSALRAGLAVSWSVDASGRRFTFALRDDAHFADGAAVTAEDAAFSLKRAVLLDKTPAIILRQLGLTRGTIGRGVRARDPHTLEIDTAPQLAPSLVYFCLTAPVASIVERQAVMAHEEEGDLGNGWLAAHSAGSGPYHLKSWRPAERYVLDANPDYWRGAPANREVIVRHLKEAAVQRLMLLRGDIDYARDLDQDQLKGLAGDPAFRVDRGRETLLTYLALNQRNTYLRRPEVVEAIKYLVDYDGIAQNLLAGTHIVHQGFEPAGLLGAINDRPFRFDPAGARALLAKAGLADGFAVSMDVVNTSPWTEVAQSLQASFATARIRLDIIPGDAKQVLTKYRARRHDIFLGEWAPDYPDPHGNAEAFAYNPDNGDTADVKTPAWRNAWSDPEMIRRVLAAKHEASPERRAALYGDLQRLHQRRAPFVFLFQALATAAHSADVDGFVIGASPTDNRYAGIHRR